MSSSDSIWSFEYSDVVLRFLVEQQWWFALRDLLINSEWEYMLKRSRKWVYQRALEHSNEKNCPVSLFLECAPDNDVPELVDKLVSWGQWKSVCFVLTKAHLHK
jgi:hypothetical protein